MLALAAGAQAAVAGIPPVLVEPNSATVGRYDIYELTLKHTGAYQNPWYDVEISAQVKSPAGKTYKVGGFYYDRNTWKVRFAPAETGSYSWSLVFRAPSGEIEKSGDFKAVASKNTGFLRVHSSNSYRLITEADRAVFYPLGLQQGFGKNKLPIQFYLPGPNITVFPAGAAEYFDTYTAAGFNLFRSNAESAVDVASFNVDNSGKNTYRTDCGQVRDELVRYVHKYGWKLLWAPMAAPNDYVKDFDLSNPKAKEAILKVYQYNIDRFGAFVDIWELMNENGNFKVIPPAFYDAAAEYIRSHDPYQHPITTSYEPPRPHPLLTVSAPHAYFNCSDQDLDREFVNGSNELKQKLPGQPILWGEIGNRCPLNGSDVANERFRILLWTSFFNESFIVPWNGHDGEPKACAKGPSNLFIGTAQRQHAGVFVKYIADFDPEARPVPVDAAPAGQVRAYALGTAKEIGGYLTHATGHNVLTSGITMTLTVPHQSMHGQWINPATGVVIRDFDVSGGPQNIPVPDFPADIAFRIRAPR